MKNKRKPLLLKEPINCTSEVFQAFCFVRDILFVFSVIFYIDILKLLVYFIAMIFSDFKV